VLLHDNKWYTFYVDTALSAYWATESGGSEMFYFTPDLPELHLKQVHMAMKYFEYKLNSDSAFTPQTIHDVQNFTRPDLFPEYNQGVGRECGPSIVAQRGGQKGNTLLTPKKREMINLLGHTQAHMDNIYRIYNGGLKKLSEISGYDVVNSAIPPITSKFYYLRDFRPINLL
jgi:hypothetical protein